MSTLQQRHRPFPMGCSIGALSVTAGTAGGLVLIKHGADTKIAVLTNYHVCKNDEDVVQPGPIDGGIVDDIVGRSKGVPIPASGGKIDAGVVILLAASLARAEILYIGIPKGHRTNRQVGDKRKLTGRTTGYREGVVMDTDAVLSIDYANEGIKTLEELVLYSPNMSQGGNSGAWVLDAENYVTELNFAGSPQFAVGCKIENALEGIKNLLNADSVEVVTEPTTVKYGPASIKMPYRIVPQPEIPPPPDVKTPMLTASLDKAEYKSGESMIVTGKVADPDTGAGLPSKLISARSDGFSLSPNNTVSDPNGNFRIDVQSVINVTEPRDFQVDLSFAGDP